MLPRGLSMLWESTDATSALQTRFGFDDVEAATRWLTETLDDTWAIEVRRCERIVISGHNAIAWIVADTGPVVSKWSRAQDQFTKLSATADLIEALHLRGMPVAAPLASVDDRRRVILRPDSSPLSMTVQPRIAGDPLDAADDAAVHAAGACLASVHRAMAGHDDVLILDLARTPAFDATRIGLGLDLHERVQKWLETEDRGTVPAASVRLRKELAALEAIDTMPQLIHNDYRASNVLTVDSRVTAVLDFDEVAWDYCVSDIARASVYLSTLFRNWRPTPQHVRRTFLEGYQSVRPLTSLEHDWLHALILWLGITAVPPGHDPAGWANAL